MKIELINNIRVIIPSDGKLLCNMTDRIISDKVYLGKNADETVWTEIDEAEREALETKWNEETEPSKNDSDYSEAGKILLGVSE